MEVEDAKELVPTDPITVVFAATMVVVAMVVAAGTVVLAMQGVKHMPQLAELYASVCAAAEGGMLVTI